MSTLKEKLEAHKKVFLTKVNDEILSIVGAAGGALAETVPNRKRPKWVPNCQRSPLSGPQARPSHRINFFPAVLWW